MHPDQTSLVPYLLESVVWGQAGRRAGDGRGWGGGVERLLGVRGDSSGLPAPLPSLFPSFLLGVPLLFVIPWGIVKYLYEDEG